MAFTTSGQETEWGYSLRPRSPHGALGKGNVDDGLRAQLEEEGSGSLRQSWTESSDSWTMFQWKRQGISQVSQGTLHTLQ